MCIVCEMGNVENDMEHTFFVRFKYVVALTYSQVGMEIALFIIGHNQLYKGC